MRIHSLLFVAVLVAIGTDAEVALAGGVKVGEYTASFDATRPAEGMDCDAWSSKGTFKFSIQVVDGTTILVPRENFPTADAIIMSKQGSTLTGVIAEADDEFTPATLVSLTFKGKRVTGRISSDAQCSAQISFQGKWKRKPIKHTAKPAQEITRVAITIQGAVIGPMDEKGAAWDGLGLSNNELQKVGGFIVGRFPVGKLPFLGAAIKEFGGDLIASIATAFDAPDPKGTATVVLDGAEVGTVELVMAPDSFAPTWEVVLPEVSVRGASLLVTLTDTDLLADDPIATVAISEEVLREAADSGGTFSIDTAGASGEMIQRLFLKVVAVP